MKTAIRRQGLRFYDAVTAHNIQRRMEELCRSQWLRRAELMALQMWRLQSVVTYAYEHVAYYRRVFDEVGFRPDKLAEDPDSFQKIPPVSKAYIRDHLEEFLTTDPARREKVCEKRTSGSTGEPFLFYEDGYFQSYALGNTFRHHTWCGWQLGEPRAYLWGRAFKYPWRERARYLAWNVYFANANNPSRETLTELAKVLRERKPKLLQGFSSAVYAFAEFVRENGWDDVKVPAVYTTSDMLYPYQRDIIEETFGCQVFNRYATEEVAGIACECEEHNGLHINTEINYVELLDEDGKPMPDGEVGSVVVTSLVSYAFPFIRYRHDDSARMGDRACPCGRGQPLLESVEGRYRDLFKSPAGHRVAVWGIDRPIREMGGVRKFQVIQKSLDHIVVRVVRDEPMTQVQEADVERAIKLALDGDEFRIDYQYPDDIPVERSGKYRYTICEID
jgi:phenylacetate-CoA ligase